MILVPTRSEMATALLGTLRIAGLDRAGVWMLDASVSGVVKSFFAAVLLAPLYFLVVMVKDYPDQPPADVFSTFMIEGAAYVAGWLIWPVLSHEISRFFSARANWQRYIVAYNWAHVWIMLVQMPALILRQSHFADPGLSAIILLLSLGLVFAYRAVLARMVLGLDLWGSLGVAVLDFVLSLAWASLIFAMVAPYAIPVPA